AFPSEEAADHAHQFHIASAHRLHMTEFFPDPSDGKKRRCSRKQTDHGIEESDEIKPCVRKQAAEMERERFAEGVQVKRGERKAHEDTGEGYDVGNDLVIEINKG